MVGFGLTFWTKLINTMGVNQINMVVVISLSACVF